MKKADWEAVDRDYSTQLAYSEALEKLDIGAKYELLHHDEQHNSSCDVALLFEGRVTWVVCLWQFPRNSSMPVIRRKRQ